ncbi:MAG: lyase [Rhodospirillales bacterium]|nr:lyase [Rhodospirillales bacterium]
MQMRAIAAAIVGVLGLASPGATAEIAIQAFDLPAGTRPHDVAVAADGAVWYTAQPLGELGRLDPATGKIISIPLGSDSRPHGVIIGPDGGAWVTDSGLNAIVRVDPQTHAVKLFPLPEPRGYTNLNTAAFDGRGQLWFTGQNGVYGRLDPASGEMQVFDAPRGRGPYGIAATPTGDIYYASLAGSHIARIDTASGAASVIEPPTPSQGARRVWSDSKGHIWVSEWNSGNVSRLDPRTGAWKTWKLPGDRPRAYAVYVDTRDYIWLSEWSANAMVRFDPRTEKFDVFPSDQRGANVRQILGRDGEVWAPESGTDRLIVYRFR